MTGLIVFIGIIVAITIVSGSAYAWSVHSESKYIDEWYERGPWYATLDNDGDVIVTNGKTRTTTYTYYSARKHYRCYQTEREAKLHASEINEQHHTETNKRAQAETLAGRPL